MARHKHAKELPIVIKAPTRPRANVPTKALNERIDQGHGTEQQGTNKRQREIKALDKQNASTNNNQSTRNQCSCLHDRKL